MVEAGNPQDCPPVPRGMIQVALGMGSDGRKNQPSLGRGIIQWSMRPALSSGGHMRTFHDPRWRVMLVMHHLLEATTMDSWIG